jgi:hypothetical protein
MVLFVFVVFGFTYLKNRGSIENENSIRWISFWQLLQNAHTHLDAIYLRSG